MAFFRGKGYWGAHLGGRDTSPAPKKENVAGKAFCPDNVSKISKMTQNILLQESNFLPCP